MTPQKRAVSNSRKRLSERDLGRFEVLGLNRGRELIRSLATQRATNSTDSLQLRETIAGMVAKRPSLRGGILAALRRSPLVGAGVNLERR